MRTPWKPAPKRYLLSLYFSLSCSLSLSLSVSPPLSLNLNLSLPLSCSLLPTYADALEARAEVVRALPYREREFFIDNLPVRIHFIGVMIRWTGLVPWEFEFSFPSSFTSTFLVTLQIVNPNP